MGLGERRLSTRVSKRDLAAGLVVVAFGATVALQAQRYTVGTLRGMGPGYVPLVIGILMTLTGVLMAMTALVGRSSDGHKIDPPDLRGCACIALGILSFIGFGFYTGLVPATFACVFISALGDRTATLKSALLTAAAITAFGDFLFAYILQVQFPLFGR